MDEIDQEVVEEVQITPARAASRSGTDCGQRHASNHRENQLNRAAHTTGTP